MDEKTKLNKDVETIVAMPPNRVSLYPYGTSMVLQLDY